MKQGVLKLKISNTWFLSHLHWGIQDITDQTYRKERKTTPHNQKESNLERDTKEM